MQELDLRLMGNVHENLEIHKCDIILATSYVEMHQAKTKDQGGKVLEDETFLLKIMNMIHTCRFQVDKAHKLRIY